MNINEIDQVTVFVKVDGIAERAVLADASEAGVGGALIELVPQYVSMADDELTTLVDRFLYENEGSALVVESPAHGPIVFEVV